MKKIITLAVAAAGAFWLLGKRSKDQPTNTWAAGTDPI